LAAALARAIPAGNIRRGSIVSTDSSKRQNFDLVISCANFLNNTPESNVWYELNQRSKLRFMMPREISP
jgi:hypothetical protein